MIAFLKRVTLIFLVLFTFSFPFPHAFLPDVGSLLSGFFEEISVYVSIHVFGIKRDILETFQSDGVIVYVHLIVLLLFSIIISCLTYLKNSLFTNKVYKWGMIYGSYYLAAILLVYGMDKIFKHQFYLPEPNTLHTPIGYLSKDIAFWSVMGASRSYTMFSGIIEVIPALFLCFSRTRMLGALVSFMVLINVLMINIGFDISVKVFTLFLLFINGYILSFYWNNIYAFFITKSSITINRDKIDYTTFRKIIIYIIPFILLFNASYQSISIGVYNDDNAPRPLYHGAYEVTRFNSSMSIPKKQTWKRVFIHRKGYFIIQLEDDNMIDFKFKLSGNNKFQLKDYNSNHYMFSYSVENKDLKTLKGKIKGVEFTIEVKTIDWRSMELLNNQFHWTVD